jgi:hypothetical protein
VSRPIAFGAAAGAALLFVSCARVGPVSRPTPDGSARVYSVADLELEVPSSWRAEGDPRKVKLSSPGNEALLEAKATAVAGPSDRCLEGAEDALVRGSASLTGVRRHTTTFAGKKAVAQEADQGGWHGWAWATCDRGEQYRVFLSGRAPVSRETIEVQRRLAATARLGGTP